LVPLENHQKATLASALGDQLEITWFEKWLDRLKVAGLNAAATDIRLRIPETFEIHRRIIDWRRKQSPSGIPAGALGLDRTSLSIMHWAMQNQARMHRFNNIMGTAPARMQMDYLPGLFCAAHFSIQLESRQEQPDRTVRLLRSGMAIQRFWLSATRMGLVVQPSLAPLAFQHLAGQDRPFTADPRMLDAGKKLVQQAAHILPGGGADTVFMGRIGYPRKPAQVRSTRLAFEALILPAQTPLL
jgi:hypothetical protein